MDWQRRIVAVEKSFHGDILGNTKRATEKTLEGLQPALSQQWEQISQPKQGQLKREVVRICLKTQHLAIEMSASKATFKVVVPRMRAHIASEDTEKERVAIDGQEASDSGSYRVSFTVFGGLERTELIPGGNEKVRMLEKAQVVGYAG